MNREVKYPLLPNKAWIAVWMKGTALLALFNLLLGLFNLSYVPMRDIYLRYFPQIVAFYDPVKGIEPHPQTEQYLDTVDRVLAQIPRTGLDSEETQSLLTTVRRQSNDLIDENPFIASGKFSTFAKLQRRILDRVNRDSAKDALQEFWSADYLRSQGARRELEFFETQVVPLLSTNYYRQTDDNGQPYDAYWRIDVWFIAFFGIEYLLITFIAARRRNGLSWFDAILRRWYDWFLFIPVWRWLRAIPVAVRLHQSKVVNMEYVLAQITYEPAAYLSDRVAEFVAIRTLNHAQESVESGDMARALLSPGDYVSVGKANSLEVISDRLLQLTIYKVLPEVKPELKLLLNHSLSEALRESAFVDLVERVPALQSLPDDVTDNLANYLAGATCDAIESAYSDEIGRERFDALTERFQASLRAELQDETTLRELQETIANVLEEVKINYVQRSAERDTEETLEQVEEVYDRAERDIKPDPELEETPDIEQDLSSSSSESAKR